MAVSDGFRESVDMQVNTCLSSEVWPNDVFKALAALPAGDLLAAGKKHHLDISRQAVAQHLAVLEVAGLVESRRSMT